MGVIDRPVEETTLPEPEVMDEADVLLLDAERYIQEHGWCQGHYEYDGKVCVVGALMAVWRQDPYARTRGYDPAWMKLQTALHGIPGIPTTVGLCPQFYNDLRSTTKEDIINLLRKARNVSNR